MPAVLQTNIWRIHPGKGAEFFTNVANARKILERLGGKVRVLNMMVGGPSDGPRSIIIIELADWRKFGEYQAKLESDAAWQEFFTTVILNNPDPSADLIGTGLSVEAPV